MTIEAVIMARCDQCKVGEEITINGDSRTYLEVVADQSKEDGWWIGEPDSDGTRPAICPDCRKANEPYDRADAKNPERM